MTCQVTTGLESLKTTLPTCLKGPRLGLLANPASVDAGLTHAKTVISRLLPGKLRALFSPQHGFYAEKQDNMIESCHARDPDLDIPVFSLYSETRVPTPEMFDPIDTLIVDIQDVGTRVYTFIYTISYCMEAAARLGKSVVILDRPNPIGGTQVEGNLLEPLFSSFVGRYPMPMRHGLTVGEVCNYINQAHDIGCDLTVIPMTGWERQMYWKDTGLVWIPPSPNLPTPLSCMVYPGQVMLEGTNLSEGRGTTLPFEQFGAPYIDISALMPAASQIPGAVLRPVNFEPTSGKWAGQVCAGFHIHVTDENRFQPYAASLFLIREIITRFPRDFSFKAPPYEYEYERLPMDLILGSQRLRHALEGRADLFRLQAEWQPELAKWAASATAYHLYR